MSFPTHPGIFSPAQVTDAPPSPGLSPSRGISPHHRSLDKLADDGTEAICMALARRRVACLHVMDQSGLDAGAMAVEVLPPRRPVRARLHGRSAPPHGLRR